MDKTVAAILFGVSLIAVIAATIDKPLTLVAFVALWWAIIKIGVWMTKERDAKNEGRRSRNTSL